MITQHFELTPQSSLTTAQASLQSELEPAILTLLSRAEAHIAKTERRQQALLARSELLEGRLEGNEKGLGLRKQRSLDKLVRKASAGGEEKALRLKALRSKKERLGYAVERLELQSQQRQRQLRMSVAAT
jgi:DASH complex subunit SPC19